MGIKKNQRIAFNPELCAGCGTCELVCSCEHFGEANKKLSAIRIDADFVNHSFDAYVCKQCKAASCLEACPKGAIKVDEKSGVKYIDKNACVKCGLCSKACPFEDMVFPSIRKENHKNEKVIIKCDLCKGRENGPACVEVCYFGALTIKTV